MTLDDIPDMDIDGFDPANVDWYSMFIVLAIKGGKDYNSRKVVYAGDRNDYSHLVKDFLNKHVKKAVPNSYITIGCDGFISAGDNNYIICDSVGIIDIRKDVVRKDDIGNVVVWLYEDKDALINVDDYFEGNFYRDIVKPIVDVFVAKHLPNSKVRIYSPPFWESRTIS